jgi:hypothetical protein
MAIIRDGRIEIVDKINFEFKNLNQTQLEDVYLFVLCNTIDTDALDTLRKLLNEGPMPTRDQDLYKNIVIEWLVVRKLVTEGIAVDRRPTVFATILGKRLSDLKAKLDKDEGGDK